MTLCSNPRTRPAFERLLDLFASNGRKRPVQQWQGSIHPDRREPARRLNRTEIKNLIAGYRSGSTVYELGSLYRIQRQTVSKILKREGVTLRLQPLTPDQIETARELYLDGLSCRRIADLLQCNDGTVRNALVRLGVTMRDSHGRQRSV
jgi:DNA invertase Pin-like site-specific DNA recombinase